MGKNRYVCYKVSKSSDDSNIFQYVGVITDYSRNEIIKANKKYIVQKIDVEHITSDCIRQKCYFDVPTTFDMDKIAILKNERVECTFDFVIHPRKYGSTKANFLHCIAIKPKDNKYSIYAQKIDENKYRTVIKGEEKDVDNEGYLYPYDY